MKRLVFIRHAHRNTSDPAKDNGLSDKGEAQVKRLLKFASARLQGSTPIFLSSPKKRCVQTLSPIAEALNAKLIIDERLSEQAPNENRSQYEARIDEFLDFYKYESDEVTVICSHGDFIPILIEKLTQAKAGLKKAGYGEIETISGESYLTWLVQNVDGLG